MRIRWLFFELGLTPCKAKQPRTGMESQEKVQKEQTIQYVCLERTYRLKVSLNFRLKGYLRYKTITSQNVPAETQVKNFFVS